MKITKQNRNTYTDVTLENAAGLQLTLCSLGASIRDIRVPDAEGTTRSVILRPADETLFAANYYGKTIGRTSGRIEGATFRLGDKTAKLDKNNRGTDNLHGGAEGFHAKVFDTEVHSGADYTDVVFSLFSPDGEGGYFGNVHATVTYRVWENAATFRILYDCTADEPTLLNLTNHVYLNVGGDLRESAKEQTLQIRASQVSKFNDRLIVEKFIPVPPELDFRTAHKIGDFVYSETVQRYTNGYDHVYMLDTHGIQDTACVVESEKSGIRLEIATTYPCTVFYANSMPKEDMAVYPCGEDQQYLALCLECQYNSAGIFMTPENCGVTTTEKPFHEETEYRFTVK